MLIWSAGRRVLLASCGSQHYASASLRSYGKLVHGPGHVTILLWLRAATCLSQRLVFIQPGLGALLGADIFAKNVLLPLK